MKRFVYLLAAVVGRLPVAVLVASLLVTVALGALLPQQERASGNEGFSPDSEEFRAGQIVGDEFDTSAIAAVQVVFTAESGDVITADGLRTYLAVQQAIESSRAPELFSGLPGGDVQGFMEPAVRALEALGADPLTAEDEQVKQAFLAGLASAPEDQRGQIELSLSSRDTDLAEPRSSAGLMIVLLNTGILEDDPDGAELQAIEVDMSDAIDAVAQQDVTASAFSFALLFADADQFQSEIGRLFGSAFGVIIGILLFVFWTSRHPSRYYGRTLGWWPALRNAAIAAGVVALLLGALVALADLAVGVLVVALVVGGLVLLWSRSARWRRSWADMGLTMGVIVMSIVWMNGIGVLLGPKYLGIIGNFNEILQIIPILLIGLGVDYAIHLTSRYREELGSGDGVVGSARRSTLTVGVALVLATVTTTVGFLTNVISPVTAIKDFGILAAVGIGSAFVLMLTFVPAVRILLDRRAERTGRLPVAAMGHHSERLLPRVMGRAAVFAERIPAVMLVAALLFGGLGAYGLSQLSTTFSFTDFLPEDAPLLETFDVLVDEFGGGLGETTNVLIEGTEVATPAVHNGIVAAWANLADTPDVLRFGERAAAQSPVSVLAQLVTPPDQGGDAELFDAGFAQTATTLGLQPDLTVAPGTDVPELYEAAAGVAPDAMRRYVAPGADGSPRYINVAVSTQGGESRALDLADNLRADFAPVDAAGVTAIPTNENIIARGVVVALQSSQVSSLTITLLAAMALLVVTFLIESRRPFLGVITILPVALVVLWVFGMMSVTGISFNPVTAMIAAIAIGIGVPYTIHITHRYQEDRLRYDDPSDAIRSTMTHTGGALAGSAFTTVAGFGVLVTSTLKPFQQLGLVTGYAIGFALVAAVLVLPSMLVLWDRWHSRRGEAAVDADAVHAVFDDRTVPALD